MKTNILFLFLISTTIIFGQNYQLDSKNSSLNWTGKAAFDAYSLSGALKAKSGSLTIENNQIKTAKIIIDMKSLAAENKDLEKHLKAKDFFEVKKYSEAIFELSSPILISENEILAKGMLTIKAISKPYIFPIKIKRKGDKFIVSGTLSIDRTDFGIYYNSPNYFKNLKQNAIADEFELNLYLEFE